MDREDFGQELELQKILGNYKYALKRVYSVQRSAAWSNSYKNKFPHVSLERVYLDRQGEAVAVADLLFDNNDWSNLVDIECDLNLFMSVLKPKEKRIMYMYYVEGYTQYEIANMYDINHSAVSKLIKKAITKVRKFILFIETNKDTEISSMITNRDFTAVICAIITLFEDRLQYIEQRVASVVDKTVVYTIDGVQMDKNEWVAEQQIELAKWRVELERLNLVKKYYEFQDHK